MTGADGTTVALKKSGVTRAAGVIAGGSYVFSGVDAGTYTVTGTVSGALVNKTVTVGPSTSVSIP